MHIRAINTEDRAEWIRMRTFLWPCSPDDHIVETERFFNGEDIDVVDVFVLDRGRGKLGGFLEVNIRNYAEGSSSNTVPYIEGWFVDDDLRKQGWGRMLVQTAESWAVENGYNEIASDCELDNHINIEAHKSMGFEETDRIVCFLKEL